MTAPCDRLRGIDPATLPPGELATHAESCPHCRAQVELDALLRRRLGSLAGGAVPSDLEARTIRRLREAQPRLTHRQRLLLGAYAMVALLLSGLVVLSLDPPSIGEIGTVAAGTLLVLTAVSLLPTLPLLRHVLGRGRASP